MSLVERYPIECALLIQALGEPENPAHNDIAISWGKATTSNRGAECWCQMAIQVNALGQWELFIINDSLADNWTGPFSFEQIMTTINDPVWRRKHNLPQLEAAVA